jgi:phosphatidylserine decarboxylase
MIAALLLGLKFKAGLVTIIIVELLLLVVLGWVLAFFRDPVRVIPQGRDILLSPADGVVSDIETIEDCPWIEGKVIRIGIFLNIFNVHINRVPCAVKIDGIEYKEGKFKNACDPESARVNEANAVLMTRVEEPCDKLVVRQISGAIARRIVCATKTGDEFKAGDQFGMIKFGSRTELYLPYSESAKVQVEIGQKVRAGLDVFVKYE